MKHAVKSFELVGDVYATQVSYRAAYAKKSQFSNAGVCIGGQLVTGKVCAVALPDFTAFTGHVRALTLGDVVARTHDVPESFYITEESIAKWTYAKVQSASLVSALKVSRITLKKGPWPFPMLWTGHPALLSPVKVVNRSRGQSTPCATQVDVCAVFYSRS